MTDFKIVKLVDPLQLINIVGSFVARGAYNNATDYSVGDYVSYNGSSYVMYVDGPAGTLPTDTTYWQVISNKGSTGATGPTGSTGTAGSPGVIQSVVAGSGITVDSSDPANPIVTATASDTSIIIAMAVSL